MGTLTLRRGHEFASPLATRHDIQPSTWSARKPVEKYAVCVVLALYAGLLAYVIPRHEPWADEAQAWELARSLSLKSLFGTYIHYEGSPGLWHALLWMLSRLHVTYAGMHWFAGSIALAGMVLLTVASPFPLVLRLMLPFTYFFAFQYSVVARSYVLFPTILFALACCWSNRRMRPLPAVLLIGLLGNVSAHAFVVALGLALILAMEWYRTPKEERAQAKAWFGSVLLLTVMLGFALWCVLPAPDAGWVVVASASGTMINQGQRWPGCQSFTHRCARCRLILKSPSRSFINASTSLAMGWLINSTLELSSGYYWFGVGRVMVCCDIPCRSFSCGGFTHHFQASSITQA